MTAALNVALLAQEEAEQERRHLRTQLATTMRKMVSVRGTQYTSHECNTIFPDLTLSLEVVHVICTIGLT